MQDHCGRFMTPTHGALPLESVATFEAALDDVLQLAMRLTVAIVTLAYADSVRLRGELEGAMLRVQALAEGLCDARIDALHQLGQWQTTAARLFMIAPTPSTAAIVAAEAGDETAWKLEEQAWIAGRQGSVMRPRALPRSRRDTHPESPHALREAAALAHSADAVSKPTARDPSGRHSDDASVREQSQRGTHDRRP
jgi:hypothetical protein